MGGRGSEDELRDFLMVLLFKRIGEEGSMTGEGASARFVVRPSFGGGECRAEGSLEYSLPSGLTLSHDNDILIGLAKERRIGIELKWQSNVTDQFKARSYDVFHLKQNLGSRFTGIMIYLRPGPGSITIARAKAICHPFDRFIGHEFRNPEDPTVWKSVLQAIETEVKGS